MAFSPSLKEQREHGSIFEEPLEEFARRVTHGIFQPPSPTMVSYETLNGLDTSSLGSTAGDVVLTPSTSSSEEEEEREPSPLELDGLLHGADAIAVTTPLLGQYPTYLDFSSPTSSSGGISYHTAEVDNTSSFHSSDGAAISEYPDQPDIAQGSGAFYWPPSSQGIGSLTSHSRLAVLNFPTDTFSTSAALYPLNAPLQNPSSFSYPQGSIIPSDQHQIISSMSFPGLGGSEYNDTSAPQLQIWNPSPVYPNQEISESPTSIGPDLQEQPGLHQPYPQPGPQSAPYHNAASSLIPTNSESIVAWPLAHSSQNQTSVNGTSLPNAYYGESSSASSSRALANRASTEAPPQCSQEQKLALHTKRQENQRGPNRRHVLRKASPLFPKADAPSPTSSAASSSPVSTTSPVSTSSQKRPMKGGRAGPLAPEDRKEAANLRGNACWPCAVMREKCSKGDPCTRCSTKSERSKAHGLGCDRRHLQRDMMPSFIPSSMDPQQIYADIMVYVTQDVGSWYHPPSFNHNIRVPFSIGVGQPFVWPCHEYRPLSQDSMRNVSWNITKRGDSWRRTHTPSPPLAIRTLDNDELSSWINRLVDQSLEDIGDMYFWEGHQLRTQILKLLCELYHNLRIEAVTNLTRSSILLRDDLHRVISLVLVTFVMNHAFTIEEERRDAVIAQLSQYNDPSLYAEMLILKTANAQLKYGFSRLRFNMHLALLNRLQTVLKNAKYREWWLSGFVVMLGLALALEEYQHLLHVQADSRIADGRDEVTCLKQAQDQCADIDNGFEFLLRLYHFKYSDRNRDRAHFGKERTTHWAEAKFVQEMRALMAPNRVVLLQRKDLEVSLTEDNHVLRIVGRFLTSMTI